MLYNLKTASEENMELSKSLASLSMELARKLQSFFDKQLDGPKIAGLP